MQTGSILVQERESLLARAEVANTELSPEVELTCIQDAAVITQSGLWLSTLAVERSIR